MFEFFEMPHFSYLILKMGKMGHFEKFEHEKVGHFKKLARDQFYNWKWTENEILRFWGISKNWEIAITWQNPPSHAFWGISWYLVYSFGEYSMKTFHYAQLVTKIFAIILIQSFHLGKSKNMWFEPSENAYSVENLEYFFEKFSWKYSIFSDSL